MKRITIAEFMSFLNSEKKCVLVDVRQADEIKTGMIDGAIHIPLHELDGRLSELEIKEDDVVVFYCRSGYRSLSACEIADQKWQGKKESYSLDGGILAWNVSLKV